MRTVALGQFAVVTTAVLHFVRGRSADKGLYQDDHDRADAGQDSEGGEWPAGGFQRFDAYLDVAEVRAGVVAALHQECELAVDAGVTGFEGAGEFGEGKGGVRGGPEADQRIFLTTGRSLPARVSEIHLEKVSFTYPGTASEPAFKDVNVTIPTGVWSAIAAAVDPP